VLEVNVSELTDAQLMAGIAAGRTALLGEIYTRYERTVKAALYHWVPSMNQADIEDVAQEVFIALGKSAASYKEQSKFKSWLYRIAKRKATDWRRGTWVRRQFFERNKEPVAMAMKQEKNSPAGKTSLREVVGQALSSLPDDQRQVLWLHFVEGFDGDEIADVLGVRRATVYTRMQRARTALSKSIHADKWREVL